MSVGCARLNVGIPDQREMANAFARCMRDPVTWSRAVMNGAKKVGLDPQVFNRGIEPEPAKGRVTFYGIPSNIPSAAIRNAAFAIMTQLTTTAAHLGIRQ